MQANIDRTAIVSVDAELGENVSIGAYAIVEADVRIGDNTTIGSHSIIKEHTYIGRGNIIHSHVMLGNLPQDIAFDRDSITYLEIGDNNEFREFANVHRASLDNSKTIIGNNCYMMANSHVAHDCIVDNNVIMCNGALLGGHVKVGRNAFISGNAVVHQFCAIGAYAMLGGLTGVTQDVLPYSLVMDVPSTLYKLNLVGLRRGGFTSEDITEVEKAHNMWYNWNSTKAEFISRYQNDNSLSNISREVVDFVVGSKRGIVLKHSI